VVASVDVVVGFVVVLTLWANT